MFGKFFVHVLAIMSFYESVQRLINSLRSLATQMLYNYLHECVVDYSIQGESSQDANCVI